MNSLVLHGCVGDMLKESRRSTRSDLLRKGFSILSEAGIGNAENEAVWILEQALGISRVDLYVNRGETVRTEVHRRAVSLLKRRAAREPLQYILGTQEFCGLDFEVGPAVLIPRPETEVLVETALRRCAAHSSPFIADIGAGSGCIVVALAKMLPAARLFAVDLSEQAVAFTRRNAIRHAVNDRVMCLQGDLFAPFQEYELRGKLAVITSNPPYIADGDFSELPPEIGVFEPRLALAGGLDGLQVHRRIIRDAVEWLAPAGWLIIEVGRGQAEDVCRMAQQQGVYEDICTIPDAASIDRIVCMKRYAEQS